MFNTSRFGFICFGFAVNTKYKDFNTAVFYYRIRPLLRSMVWFAYGVIYMFLYNFMT